MNPMPEGQVPIRIVGDVQPIGVGELSLVAIGRPQHSQHHLATWNNDIADRDILARIALGREIHRAAVAQ